MKKALLYEGNTLSKAAKILLLMLPLSFPFPVMDNDLWFTMNHGRYLLEHGFTNIEPFTVHGGLMFSFEKWATCISFYKIYDWFGAGGLFVFVLLIFALIIWVFYKFCMLVSGNSENISIVVTVVVMSFLGYSYVRTRPQIFSYLFLIAGLYSLEKYARSGDIKRLYPLPLYAFLYMQFHSTMLPIFFIICLPYLCDFKWFRVLGVNGSAYKKWPILVAMLVSAIATLANPYGFRSFVYLINSLNDGGLLSNINEVKHSSINDILTCTGGVLAFQLVYIALRIGKKEVFPLRYFLLSVGTFAMALYAVRNNAFYTLIGGAVCAWELKSISTGYNWMPPLKKLAGLAALISMIYCAVWPYNLMRNTYAYEVMDEFKSLHPDTNISMYTDFNCGSYAEWLGYRCYADPRAEVFIKSINGKEDILAEVWDSMHNRITAAELQEKYNFDYWLVQDDYSLDRQIRNKDDYEKVCSAGGYNVYKYLPNDK